VPLSYPLRVVDVHAHVFNARHVPLKASSRAKGGPVAGRPRGDLFNLLTGTVHLAEGAGPDYLARLRHWPALGGSNRSNLRARCGPFQSPSCGPPCLCIVQWKSASVRSLRDFSGSCYPRTGWQSRRPCGFPAST